MKCRARQCSDQMVCHECGLAWDTNDPDPPTCNSGQPVSCSTAAEVSRPLKLHEIPPPRMTYEQARSEINQMLSVDEADTNEC